VNADNKEQLQVEETDNSCRDDFIDIVPATRDADGSCTTECVSEVKQENMAVVKQESDDVCHVICLLFICSQVHNRKYCAGPGQEVTFLNTV